jgi:hypothetical protein
MASTERGEHSPGGGLKAGKTTIQGRQLYQLGIKPKPSNEGVDCFSLMDGHFSVFGAVFIQWWQVLDFCCICGFFHCFAMDFRAVFSKLQTIILHGVNAKKTLGPDENFP